MEEKEGKFDFFNVHGSKRLITLARARQRARGILHETALPTKYSAAGWGCKALLVYESRPPFEVLLPIASDWRERCALSFTIGTNARQGLGQDHQLHGPFRSLQADGFPAGRQKD